MVIDYTLSQQVNQTAKKYNKTKSKKTNTQNKTKNKEPSPAW